MREGREEKVKEEKGGRTYHHQRACNKFLVAPSTSS
jgi:hypothetical protein